MTTSKAEELRTTIESAIHKALDGTTGQVAWTPMLDDVMQLLSAYLTDLAEHVPEMQLDDVPTEMFPTPEEYEKMVWALKWQRDQVRTILLTKAEELRS